MSKKKGHYYDVSIIMNDLTGTPLEDQSILIKDDDYSVRIKIYSHKNGEVTSKYVSILHTDLYISDMAK